MINAIGGLTTHKLHTSNSPVLLIDTYHERTDLYFSCDATPLAPKCVLVKQTTLNFVAFLDYVLLGLKIIK